MKLSFIVLIFSLLAACSSSLPVSAPVELTPLENKINISRQWKFTVGEGVSEFYLKLKPIVNGNTGYVVDYKGILYAFNLVSGNQLWDTKLNSTAAGGLTFFEEKLFLGNSNGQIIALSAKDSKELWRTQLSSEVLSSPAVANGVVVAKTIDGRIYGLDFETGKRLWVYEVSVPRLTLRGNSSAVIYEDIVLSASDSGKLTALTLKQGKVLWETTIAVAQGRNQLERIVDLDIKPIVKGDVVYVAGYQSRLAAVKINSGEVIWNRDFSSYSGLSVDDANVYITDAMGQAWALNRYNGSTIWRQDKLLRRQLTAPQIQGKYLVVADYDGYMHWLSREDGALVARKHVNGFDFSFEEDDDPHPDDIDKELELLFSKVNNILVTPIIINKFILALDRSGHLEAFKIEKLN